jgi:hypothetical protein
MIFLKIDQKLDTLSGSVLDRIQQFDPIGNTLFIVSAMCLLLSVEWASTTYGWPNGRTIVLFIMFGLGMIAFVASQIMWKETATVPSRIVGQRTVIFASIFAFCISSTVFVVVFYLAIWFQAVDGLSPIMSAVHTLPMIIAQLLGTFLSAGLTTKFGYYMPFVLASTVMLSIGSGLITTYHVGIHPAQWMGYQIALGFGIGFGYQQPNIAVQSALPIEDVPTGVALVFTAQFLGGSVILAAAQNTFEKYLHRNMAALKTPGFDATSAINAGVSKLHQLVPPEYLEVVILGYTDAIIKVFRIAVIMACLSAVGAAGMEWRNVKKDRVGAVQEEELKPDVSS